jgi:hypothetical protein
MYKYTIMYNTHPFDSLFNSFNRNSCVITLNQSNNDLGQKDDYNTQSITQFFEYNTQPG